MNWKDRIARAKEVGFFTEADAEEANSFATCALSERADEYEKRWPAYILPESQNIPADQELFDLGMAFANLIGEGDIEGVEACYQSIQERIEELRRYA